MYASLLLLLTVCAAGAFDGRAPAPILPAGTPVTGDWQVSPGNVYRICVPVEGARGKQITAQLRVNDTLMTFWPLWHGPGALRPTDTLVGYAVIPPDLAGPATVVTDAPAGVTFGPPAVTDLGILAPDPPAVLWLTDFTAWPEPGRPAGFGSVAFAKPGQLVASDDGAHNREGRALLFGDNVPCRFGELLRLTAVVRGPGRVSLAVTPYVAGMQRGLVARWVEETAGDDWRTVELLVGQHLVAADGVLPMVQLWGDITIRAARLERLAVER